MNNSSPYFNLVQKKILPFLYWLSIILTIVAIYNLFQHRWHLYFAPAVPQKDEVEFVSMFTFYMDHGWYQSVANGSSPLFNFFSGIVYWFVPDYLFSLKWLNLLCMVGMILIWAYFLMKDLGVKGKIVVPAILFLVHVGCMRNTYFVACNDSLFILFMSVGFVYLYRALVQSEKNLFLFVLSGVFFAFALSVRELFVLYAPGLVIVFVLAFYKNIVNVYDLLSWVGAFLLVLIMIHFPSLKEKHTLSFHNKNPGFEHSWSERNYLWITQGNQQKPTWEDVAQYKKMHGENSLPKNLIKAMFKSPSVMASNFLRLAQLSIKPFLRQLGFIYFILMSIIAYGIFKRSILQTPLWMPFTFYLFFTICLCVQLASMLEFRWFMLFTFMLSVFGIAECQKLFKKSITFEVLFYLNLMAVAIFNALLIGIW